MYVIAAYVVVAILVVIVIWAVRHRRKKSKKSAEWSMKKKFAELEDMQRRLVQGDPI